MLMSCRLRKNVGAARGKKRRDERARRTVKKHCALSEPLQIRLELARTPCANDAIWNCQPVERGIYSAGPSIDKQIL
jgi:hypothetical protein